MSLCIKNKYLISCRTHDIKDLKIIGKTKGIQISRTATDTSDTIENKILSSNHHHFNCLSDDAGRRIYFTETMIVCPGLFKIHDADEYVKCCHYIKAGTLKIQKVYQKPF